MYAIRSYYDILFVYTDAGVADEKFQSVFPRHVVTKFNFAFCCEFDRVVYKLFQNLSKQVSVRLYSYNFV